MNPPIDLDTVRGWALALPETEEAAHFGLPGLDATHVVVSIAHADAAPAVAADPETFEEVWRSGGPNGRIFVGLRVDLARVDRERLRALVEQAWA